MDAVGPVLVVPVRGVVVLVGASGAGKSTFARRHFGPTEILSSDAFRAMVSDDERDQTASPAAFDLLHRALAHRLRRGRLSVVDATNATPGDRGALLRLAAIARRPAAAIVLDLPESSCLERNAGRDGRTVDPDVVRRQLLHVRRTLADPDRLLAEGFAVVHVLDDVASIDGAHVVRDEGARSATAPNRARAGPTVRTRPGATAEAPRTGDAKLSPRRSAPPDRTA